MLPQSYRLGRLGAKKPVTFHLLKFGIRLPPFFKFKSPLGNWIIRMCHPGRDDTDVVAREFCAKARAAGEFHLYNLGIFQDRVNFAARLGTTTSRQAKRIPEFGLSGC